MAKNKEPLEDNDQYENPQLVEKVDAMMDPKKEPDSTQTEDVNEVEDLPIEGESSSEDAPPPLDIFAEAEEEAPGAPPMDSPKKKGKAAKKVAKDEHQDAAGDEVLEETPISSEKENAKPAKSPKPEEYDDPQTAKAVDDIVSHESDAVLGIVDANLANAEANSTPVKTEQGHKIFWFSVVIICLVAIVLGLYIINPTMFHSVVSKIHWSSIRRHL